MATTLLKRIIGIDPGYARMGWAIVEASGQNPRLIACGCIETNKELEHAMRLAQIAQELRACIDRFHPDRLVIEQLLFTKNQTTGLKVAEARGVVLAVAGANALEVVEVGPMQVKMSMTGFGNADKKQVQEMVKRILGLAEAPTPDDAADACAIALSGSGKIIG